MNRYCSIWLISLMCLFGSCDYTYQKQIGENYFIRCIESRERMDIGFGEKDGSEGLIQQTVFEVHWDNSHILAKRHPSGFGSPEIDRSITEYYVVKKVKFGEDKASKNMFGPLDLNQYEKKKLELSIDESNMESIVFDDLK